jgi:hypothetical protein
VKGLEKNSLPSRHQASEGEHSLRLAEQPRIQGLVLLLLAGVMLCRLGIFPSLPAPTSEVAGVPSALVGANAEHVDGAANAPAPLPGGSYPLLMPAEEAQETDSPPVNAPLLTMLMLACSFGASVLRMQLTNARRQGATCSSGGDDPRWLYVAYEDPSFLEVFRLLEACRSVLVERSIDGRKPLLPTWKGDAFETHHLVGYGGVTNFVLGMA